ncbi:hypothetical protein I0C86_23360 [Plantactinospora sp. S1510]|uniref:Uncharacterized protein n=1 Tax=Plantactinospora alkalitolerans TaxID=2789879 RepID=A0ABS0H0C7_9ACTN|nr:hypothetical protein [Plantactinospora alkalitolerans]MBF9131880.1 hypothetical protein [Plantactinospora alkalitolerans]
MSSSVEIYVRYSGDGSGLAHRAAEDFGALTYFSTDGSSAVPIQAQPWIGIEGWAHLDLEPTDLTLYGEPGSAEDTALAPYEWVFSLSFRVGPPDDPAEVLERFGRVVFDQLTTLGLPLAYGAGGLIYADFLPGRGVREFPPDTDVEEPGQAWWFEPRLHGQPLEPWSVDVAPLSVPPSNPVTVFVTSKVLQFVPRVWDGADWYWGTPRSSTPITAQPREIALMLSHAQRTRPGRAADESESILSVLAGGILTSIEDYRAQAISIEIGTDADGLFAAPHGPCDTESGSRELLGPALDGLVRRLPEPVRPEALGEFLLSLIAATRSQLKEGPHFGRRSEAHMASKVVYLVSAFGEVEQPLLQQLRADLGLRGGGRLTDAEDEEFGSRGESVGDGEETKVLLSLWRSGATVWTLRMSYDGDTRPPEALIDDYRAECLRAFERAGMVVRRELRRGSPTRRGVGPEGCQYRAPQQRHDEGDTEMFGRAMTIHLAGNIDRERVDALRSSLSLQREGRFDDDYDQRLGRRTDDVEGGRLRIGLYRDDTHGPWSFRVLSEGEPTAAALRAVEEEIIAAVRANNLDVERLSLS